MSMTLIWLIQIETAQLTFRMFSGDIRSVKRPCMKCGQTLLYSSKVPISKKNKEATETIIGLRQCSVQRQYGILFSDPQIPTNVLLSEIPKTFV